MLAAHPLRARHLAAALGFALSFFGSAGPAFGQAAGAANVTYQWTDRQGGTHVLKNDFVDGVEVDPAFDDPAGSGYTNSFGIFVFTGSDPELFQSQTEFNGNVWASIGSGATEYARVRPAQGSAAIWITQWPQPAGSTFDVPDPPGTANFTFTIDNTSESGRAIGMLQYVDFMRSYYVGTLGAAAPFVPIDYSDTTNGSFYCSGNLGTASCMEQRIQIDNNNWASPDVVMHEYGHHIAFSNNIGGVFGGTHFAGVDNIGGLNGGLNSGAGPGSRRAFGEGVATYLGLTAVDAGNISAAIPGLPTRDVDFAYETRNTPLGNTTSGDPDITIRVNAEHNNPPEVDIATGGTPKGEGDEMAVLRVLWDARDANNEAYGAGQADSITLGAQSSYNLLVGNQTFKDFWVDLAEAVEANPAAVGLGAGAAEPVLLTRLGATLVEYRVSNVVLDTPDGPSQMPTLQFTEQNNDNSVRNRILIYSSDWGVLVHDSGAVVDGNVGETTYSYVVPAPLAAGTYNWVALTDSALDAAAAPGELDDWYWSWYDSFTVVPEPGTALLVGLGLAAIAHARRSRSRG